DSRPYVILNAAMTIDGKIASRTGDTKLSGDQDLRRVHELRSQVDAIMVGIKTVLNDDPKLTTKWPGGKNPLKVIVDSGGRTPPKSQAITFDKSTKTLIATSKKATKLNIDELVRAGAEVFITGEGEIVDLMRLMKHLKTIAINKLLLEGGGTLNWSMISLNLVDEIRVAVTPIIIGGQKATTLVDGEGFDSIQNSFRLRLESVQRLDGDVILTYKFLH
ncbi:MAG: 2,5-diamino-6-(ribosylamino)-4(3H)-pyrimidinone 5'-phosphate reductase, partial [Candidatus Bathyarchaeia archaeon]